MPRGRVGRGPFPPEAAITIKALACDRPLDDRRRPLCRFSVWDVYERAVDAGLSLSYSTVWRLLSQDAIRPWLQEQWLFPRDPLLLEKATPILELYHRRWQGKPLDPGVAVLCADEMTGLQAKSRLHKPLPPAPGRRGRYEFEYQRHGTLCYSAFLNVFTGRVCGQPSDTSGITPFERTLEQALHALCPTAAQVYLIVDNGSAHHPNTSPERIRGQYPHVQAVHLPVHSSWLNQIEIYFSIVHRKLLSPADFDSTDALARALAAFQHHYNGQAQPFRWNYTREKLERYLQRLAEHEALYAEAQTSATVPRSYPLMN